ncbi:MAG: hypothetical protein IT175_02270 [Acidobacteria bacterium]|nr:hypothetical protein [Acidobacteriota bacterium]
MTLALSFGGVDPCRATAQQGCGIPPQVTDYDSPAVSPPYSSDTLSDSAFVAYATAGGPSATVAIPVTRFVPGVDATGHIPEGVAAAMEEAGLLRRQVYLIYSYSHHYYHYLDHDRSKTSSAQKDMTELRPRLRGKFNGTDVTERMELLPPIAVPKSGPGTETIRLNGNVAGFLVDITEITFPAQQGINGGAPSPGVNTFEWQFEEGTIGNTDCPCCNYSTFSAASLSWVGLEIHVMAPLVLVHGINVPPSIWEQHCTLTMLKNLKVPYGIAELGKNSSVEKNAHTLSLEIKRIANELGVKHVHLVAVSKGGIDARRFLRIHYGREAGDFGPIDEKHPNRIDVLSLHMLATPNQGSVLSDLLVETRDYGTQLWVDENGNPQTIDPSVTEYLNNANLAHINLRFLGISIELAGPRGPGLRDLTTDKMSAFNFETTPLGQIPGRGTVPAGLPVYTYSGDADFVAPLFDPNLPNDECISESEAKFQFDSVEGLLDGPEIARFASAQYSLLRRFGRIRGTGIGSRRIPRSITPLPVTPLQDNDLLVTDISSRYSSGLGPSTHRGPFDKNHSRMRDQHMFRRVLKSICCAFPVATSCETCYEKWELPVDQGTVPSTCVSGKDK